MILAQHLNLLFRFLFLVSVIIIYTGWMIWKLNTDGSVQAIYWHSDGQPDMIGENLLGIALVQIFNKL